MNKAEEVPESSSEPRDLPPHPPEAPPSYNSINSPFGLEQLSTLSRVDIRQRQITTEHGEVIFGLKRELLKKGCSATFFFYLYDKTGNKVISLKPVNACCSARLEVRLNGHYLSKVTLTSIFYCTPKYNITDPNGGKALKIYTPGIGQAQRFLLRLKDMQGNQIGTITKKWNGLADEIQEANVQYQYR